MNLLTRNIVLLALDAFGGKTEGKTLFQKRLYFLNQLLKAEQKVRLGLGYDAHYYGPYSGTVSADIATLVNQGFIKEEGIHFGVVNSAGFEMKRYSYELTEDGRIGVDWLKNAYPEEAKLIADTVQRIQDAGTVDYINLSIAAKAHWILQKTCRPMTPKNIVEEAGKFSWTVNEQQIDGGLQFLDRLGLALRK